MWESRLNRRMLFKYAAGAAATLALPLPALAGTRSRSLAFYNLHTGEKLSTVYWEEGRYIQESLADIDRLLRDYRNGETLPIAPRLLDTLFQLRSVLDSTEPFDVISGYRSPATNARLQREGHGVAANSLHTKGMAADIRIRGRSLPALHRAALSLKAGGVGYYPASQFVHVDIGRVRTW